MKILPCIALLFLSISACAQDKAPMNFAILKTDYREGSFKVFYENGTLENLIDTLKLVKYLDKVSQINAKAETDRILFRCLEYLEAKGYELVTFSLFSDGASNLTTITENRDFYREYILRKRRN
jgi:hypothetical protein